MGGFVAGETGGEATVLEEREVVGAGEGDGGCGGFACGCGGKYGERKEDSRGLLGGTGDGRDLWNEEGANCCARRQWQATWNLVCKHLRRASRWTLLGRRGMALWLRLQHELKASETHTHTHARVQPQLRQISTSQHSLLMASRCKYEGTSCCCGEGAQVRYCGCGLYGAGEEVAFFSFLQQRMSGMLCQKLRMSYGTRRCR